MKRKKALKLTPLEKMIEHHPKHCAFWIFSGDRHCSCGRDEAVRQLLVLDEAGKRGGDEMIIKHPPCYDVSHWKIVPDFKAIYPRPLLMITKATQGVSTVTPHL